MRFDTSKSTDEDLFSLLCIGPGNLHSKNAESCVVLSYIIGKKMCEKCLKSNNILLTCILQYSGNFENRSPFNGIFNSGKYAGSVPKFVTKNISVIVVLDPMT